MGWIVKKFHDTHRSKFWKTPTIILPTEKFWQVSKRRVKRT